MRIAFVSSMYSVGMGYTENCLPKALGELGHEVHVLTSTLQVYATSPDFKTTYEHFLGKAEQPQGTFEQSGFLVRRLPCRVLGQRVFIHGLRCAITQLKPDVIQIGEAASLHTPEVVITGKLCGIPVFTECHQHASIQKALPKGLAKRLLKRIFYWLTRRLPMKVCHRAVTGCFAISNDTSKVAIESYGIPSRMVHLIPLGTDTSMFHPLQTAEDFTERSNLRRQHGIGEEQLVCIYTGRFSDQKDPLLLARALGALSSLRHRPVGVYIGGGKQMKSLQESGNALVLPFKPVAELPKYYRLADIGVWPREESMSMLDCASSGIPIIANSTMGDMDRVRGNGLLFESGSAQSLATAIEQLADKRLRQSLGVRGRQKMVDEYSWKRRALQRLSHYTMACGLSN